MKREVVLSPDAIRQFRALRAFDRRRLKEVMVQQLGESDPTEETRNRFRLRRASVHADFELRVADLRVFYRVLGDRVQVALIGRKVNNELIIEGRRFVL